MSGLYGFASRLSGCMAGLCAVLALLALPSRSQADTLSDCQACCQGKGFVDQQLSECVGYCIQGSGPCAATLYNCTANCSSPFCPGEQANPCANFGCPTGDNGKCASNQCQCFGAKKAGKYDCKGCE